MHANFFFGIGTCTQTLKRKSNVALNGEITKTIKERITEVSFYIQSLTAPEVFPKVRDAVERKDKSSLVKECRKAKIPEAYLGTVASVLLSVGPDQKWPEFF